ncbi:hypothetical protein HanIR_Chr15g0749421 [Helianthus annuus]|nr:hypothetical protein HanIR_Chr15g0749421 [Helianthus annuus]
MVEVLLLVTMVDVFLLKNYVLYVNWFYQCIFWLEFMHLCICFLFFNKYLL